MWAVYSYSPHRAQLTSVYTISWNPRTILTIHALLASNLLANSEYSQILANPEFAYFLHCSFRLSFHTSPQRHSDEQSLHRISLEWSNSFQDCCAYSRWISPSPRCYHCSLLRLPPLISRIPRISQWILRFTCYACMPHQANSNKPITLKIN